MKKLNKERVKTLILTLLIATSVIQIGIRWNQQFQWLPINFITQIFNGGDKLRSSDIDKLKYSYFLPKSITVGPNSPRWKLNEKEAYYNRIWDDIKDNYLPAMIKQKPSKILPKNQWPQITDVFCIRIEFYDSLPSDIILSANEISSNERSFNFVEEIAVLPESDVNKTVNTVYIYDENQIYQYQVNIENDFLPKSFYTKLRTELDSQNKARLSVLSVQIEKAESPDDILVSLSKSEYNTYEAIKIETPPSIELKMSNIENESIQDEILLNQKDSLMAEYDEYEGEAVFTDTENLYRLLRSGLLEYKYLPALDKKAGSIADAFRQALNFIEPRRSLLGDAEIVLTDIEKDDNYYIMRFDYKYEGVRIFYSADNSDKSVSSPLIVKANAERVLECKWMIQSVTKTGKPKRHNVYFVDLINKQIPSLYPEIIERERWYFERIEPGYVFGVNANASRPIYPEWIVSTDVKDYFIPIPEAEG